MATTATLVLKDGAVVAGQANFYDVSATFYVNELKLLIRQNTNSSVIFTKTYQLLPGRTYVVDKVLDVFDIDDVNGGLKWTAGTQKYFIDRNELQLTFDDDMNTMTTDIATRLIEPIVRPKLVADSSSSGGGGGQDARVDRMLYYLRWALGDECYQADDESEQDVAPAKLQQLCASLRRLPGRYKKPPKRLVGHTPVSVVEQPTTRQVELNEWRSLSRPTQNGAESPRRTSRR